MTEDIGKLVLRLSLGILVLLHGIAKLQHGVEGIAGMLASHGLPTVLAYGVYLGEIVGPVLLVIGLFTRIGALLIVGNMVVAFALAHMQQIFSLNSSTGGWALELQGLYLSGAIAVALLGAGAYSVGGRNGRYN